MLHLHPVIARTHAAFGRATNLALGEDGTVPTVTVTFMRQGDLDVDLFGAKGFEVHVNPTWALALTTNQLTSMLDGLMRNELDF